MGSARGACSLVSDSARAPIVVHLRSIPQIYEFDHGPRPDSSGVVVHMGSARGACSLGSDSARASIVFTSGL